MNKPVIHMVIRSDGGWEGLYVDGVLVEEAYALDIWLIHQHFKDGFSEIVELKVCIGDYRKKLPPKVEDLEGLIV